MDHAAWRKRNAVLVEYFIGSTAQSLYGIVLKNRFRFALRRTGSGFDFFVKRSEFFDRRFCFVDNVLVILIGENGRGVSDVYPANLCNFFFLRHKVVILCPCKTTVFWVSRLGK